MSVKNEKQVVRLPEKDFTLFDVSDFDDMTLDEVALFLLQLKENVQEHLADDIMYKLKSSSWDCSDVGVRFYRYETDEELNTRLTQEQQKLDKERERDLQLLKKLKAKYPDVKL